VNAACATCVLILLALAGCSSGGGSGGGGPAPASQPQVRPERILPAPKDVLSAGQPQPGGTTWMLAGTKASRGLFKIDLVTGRAVGSVPVSGAARSVAESLTGVLGLALGTPGSGALELMNGATAAVTRTVPLGAPGRDVVAGSDGSTFYVLNGTGSSSSVTVVDSRAGRVQGTVPVPLNTVSIVPGPAQDALYALQPDGRVSEIAVAGGKVMASFAVGDSGDSIALSPDGATLYALKDHQGAADVAVVDLATESVRKALPAPIHCLEVLVSADGRRLYEVVGTPGYGNIQVFGL
jgi:DNA-binding beta-propeller fold protein YncE